MILYLTTFLITQEHFSLVRMFGFLLSLMTLWTYCTTSNFVLEVFWYDSVSFKESKTKVQKKRLTFALSYSRNRRFPSLRIKELLPNFQHYMTSAISVLYGPSSYTTYALNSSGRLKSTKWFFTIITKWYLQNATLNSNEVLRFVNLSVFQHKTVLPTRTVILFTDSEDGSNIKKIKI